MPTPVNPMTALAGDWDGSLDRLSAAPADPPD